MLVIIILTELMKLYITDYTYNFKIITQHTELYSEWIFSSAMIYYKNYYEDNHSIINGYDSMISISREEN